MPIPNRKYTKENGGYRYGFNGKEKLDEIKGESNSLDFGARIYDPRLGKLLSVDLKSEKYLSYSPYSFALDNPIMLSDVDGNDIIGLLALLFKNNFNGMPVMTIISNNEVFKKLTSNFAVGGMYDKAKIYLKYDNIPLSAKDAKGTIHQEGSYKSTIKGETNGVGRTEIFAVVNGKSEAISFSKLTEDDVKNVERWVVNVKTDQRLYADGAVGVIVHETATHALTQGKFIHNFLNGKEGDLKTAQAKYNEEIAPSDPKAAIQTEDHKNIANNTGDFKDLNTSLLNTSFGYHTPGANIPFAGPYKALTVHDLIVGFLNGMVQMYNKSQPNPSNPPMYKGSEWAPNSNTSPNGPGSVNPIKN